MVMLTIDGKVPCNVTFEEVPDWRIANFPLLHQKLGSVDWTRLDNLDTLQSWNIGSLLFVAS